MSNWAMKMIPCIITVSINLFKIIPGFPKHMDEAKAHPGL
jgi:hypothetical protein